MNHTITNSSGKIFIVVLLTGFAAAAFANSAGADDGGQATVSIQVAEREATATVPCRIHLFDSAGKPVKPEGYPFWHDHFVCDGEARFKLPAGEYRCEIERGPEFTSIKKSFVAKANQTLTFEEK